ncbi:hypothetical protein ACWKT5_19945 [Streptomyces avermitilis]
MHAQDDSRVKEHRADRASVTTRHGAKPPGGVPAAFDPLSGGALSPAALTAVQRAAGNAAATRMLQRATATEQQEGGQPSAGASPHQPYEQTVEEYRASGGPSKLYRSIRIESQLKFRADRATVTAEADGNLGAGMPAKEVSRIYQTLKEWPRTKNIEPVDANAAFTVAHHVGGDNYGTQYISFSPDYGRAADYAQHDFKLGPAENLEGARKPRSVRKWAPVIEIDIAKLGPGNRLVNLGNPNIAGLTNLKEVTDIASMASNDSEVLIKGAIPAGAVTKVYGVEDAVKSISLEARKNLIEQDFQLGKRPAWESAEQEEWDALYRRKVPDHFDEHFSHVRGEAEEEQEEHPSHGKRRMETTPPPRPGASAGEAGTKPNEPGKKPKKKKPKTGMLSFDPDAE